MVIHLVKLINKTHAFVSQDKSSTFKRPLACDGILVHSSGETDCTCTLASSINDAMVDFFDVLEELRLGCAWVTEQKHIYIASDAVLVVHIFWLSTEHSQAKAFLNEVMTIDRGRYGADQSRCNVTGSGRLSDLCLFFVGQIYDVLVALTFEIVDLNDGLKDGEAVLDVREVVVAVDVDAVDLDFVTGASDID